MLERLDEAATFFRRRVVPVKYLRHTYCGQSFFSPIRLVLKSHAVEGGSRLQEGRTEVMPSMAARSDRKLGVNGCRGAS